MKLRAPRPGLEPLEDRTCPTTIGTNEAGDVLRIQGDRIGAKSIVTQADTVTILQDDSANTLIVIVNDSTQSLGITARGFSSSQFRRIEIDLDNGNDSVAYHLVSNHTRAKEIDVQTGSGADRVVMNMGQVLYSPSGDPTSAAGKIHAALDIAVDTGSESDRVWVDLGTVEGFKSTVAVDIDVDLDNTFGSGNGNDELNAGVWGHITRANVSFTAEGRGGDDVMRFAGRWHPRTAADPPPPASTFWLAIASGSSLVVDMDGGSGRDLVRASLINDLRGQLVVRLDGGEDSDSGLAADGFSQRGVSASITLLPTSTGTLDARLFGGDGDDAMGFDFQNQSNAIVLNALLDGGDGRDTPLGVISANVTRRSV